MTESFNISTYPQLQPQNKNEKIPLVLIHGWGLNSAVWQPFIEGLSKEFTDVFYIITVDLPGFGTNVNKELSSYSLINICKCIANSITQPAVYLGWSLGGLVATEMALSYPEKVFALITVASTPRFIEEIADPNNSNLTGWSGLKPKIFDAFHQQLQVDTKETIRGFLKIQAMGSPHIRQDIKQITQLVFQHEMANKATLDQSLRLLETSDYRQQLQAISQPFLRLYGDADSLVPNAIIEKIAELAKNSDQHVFKGASHAPFISHVIDFKKILSNWLIAKAKTSFS